MWLPDGKNLLVPVMQRGRASLYRVNLDTGEFTLALENGWGATALSPDGKTIYVMNYFMNYEGILAVDLATGHERQVFVAPEPQRIEARLPLLALSPDGQTLVFQLGRRSFLIGVDGSGLRELPTGDAGPFAWSRDNRAILFPVERKLMRSL